VQALLAEAGGAAQEALAALGGVWDWCQRAGFALEYPVLGPDLVRLAPGDPGRAEQVAAAVDESRRPTPPSLDHRRALRCRSLAEDDPELLCAATDASSTSPPGPSWPPRSPGAARRPRRARARPAGRWLGRGGPPERALTLKRVYWEHDEVRLQPANARYKPMYRSSDGVRIRGVAVEVIHRYRL
jgi:hypothetical protein